MNHTLQNTWRQRLSVLTEAQRERLVQRLGLPGQAARLVACIVTTPESGGCIDEMNLREFLRNRLLPAMMPTQYVLLDQLPRTATGKLDRRVLPEFASEQMQTDDTLVLPRSPIEADIAAMWSEVLDIEPIGIHDNFFDIGGDSLLVIRVVSRIRQAFQLDISPRLIFESPVLEDLAAEIEALQVAAEPAGERDEIEL